MVQVDENQSSTSRSAASGGGDVLPPESALLPNNAASVTSDWALQSKSGQVSFSTRGPASLKSSTENSPFDDDEDELTETGSFRRRLRGSRRRKGGNYLQNLARSEATKIRRARRCLTLVWVVATAGMAILVRFVTRRFEVERFEEQFHDDADQMRNHLNEAMDLTFGAMDFLALNVASYAQASNSTWPRVRIPNFAARAEKTRALTGATVLFFSPFVTQEERPAWEEFTAQEGPSHTEETLDLQARQNTFVQERLEALNISSFDDLRFINVIYDAGEELAKPLEEQGTVGLDPASPGPFLPVWQNSPVIPLGRLSPYNTDALRLHNAPYLKSVLRRGQPILAAPFLIPAPEDDPVKQFVNGLVSNFYANFLPEGEEPVEPISSFIYPIIDESADWVVFPTSQDELEREIDDDQTRTSLGRRVVGVLTADTYWRQLFRGVLNEGHNGLILVFSGLCSDSFTYEINGPQVRFLGAGDQHETKFDDLELSTTSEELSRFDFRNQVYTGLPIRDETCPFTIRLYPSSTLEDEFLTSRPLIFSLVSVAMSLLAGMCFILYDRYVQRRNRRVVKSAERTDAIVANMLPANIQEKLYMVEVSRAQNAGDNDMLDDDYDHDDVEGGIMFGTGHHGPLAELYPTATVVYLGIAGFTAWSSTREPGQVFELLESIYSSWDKLAYTHNVMKIETVGDYYVAVAGLPEPRDDHVLAIARFARDVVYQFPSLTRKLEVALGPDASDLKVRAGIHSGQITGGLLRGSMTRYQLFGDTVNTASLLLKSCEMQAIQMSNTSADLLRIAGKERWLAMRKDLVELEGKGSMETYWMLTKARNATSAERPASLNDLADLMAPINEDADDVEGSSTHGLDEADLFDDMDETNRLVEWTTRVLTELLQQILAARDNRRRDDPATISKTEKAIGMGGTVLEEFVEIIELPQVKAEDLQRRRDPKSVEISQAIQHELRSYVAVVASMYRDNSFHSFQHACHVTASVRKLLSRIVQVDKVSGEPRQLTDLSGHSYGITSDPLTQFAVVLSAIIHDCDHPGVPNSCLVKEKTHNSVVYKEKSVAEQNSVDLCWKLLMSSNYANLRACIYHNKAELLRFRQLMVNMVMATDIVDKELGALRKARWNVAFSEETVDSTPELDMNRKATIVLEHLIQASDVSHTMQHWEVYIEWNERFFFELYSTYKAGRADSDPSVGWYKGEIGFFDFYVIPLAKKLDKCGVFGVSSHEYLDYAQANRRLWVEKGKDCVERFLAKYKEVNEQFMNEIP